MCDNEFRSICEVVSRFFRSVESIALGFQTGFSFLRGSERRWPEIIAFLRAAGHVLELGCSLKYSLGVICCLLFLKKTVEEAKSM